MPTPNELATSVMARDAIAMRNAMVRRVIYAIADDEDPTDFVANTSGVVPLGLAFGGVIFWLDPNDTTSTHDGVTVIVTDDGYRYHVSDFRMPWAVLATDQVEPPSSSAIGDAFLTNAAPSGDWAGHGEQVAVWTSRGWVFVEPQLGQLIYVADGSNRWVYLDENGTIVERFGMQPASIPDGALIGGQRRFIVESQTVNTPPGAPALGHYWIIGSAPTGDWAGSSGKIATSYDGGTTWTIIDPLDGVEAYDRTQGSNYIYRTGVGWVSAAGAWTRLQWVRTNGTESMGANTSNTIWNGSATPTTAMNHRVDNISLSFQASRTGATLKVRYHANVDVPPTGVDVSNSLGIALFRDAEANAIDWAHMSPPFKQTTSVVYAAPSRAIAEFFVPAPDSAAHSYRVGFISRGGTNEAQTAHVNEISRRVFSIEEAF